MFSLQQLPSNASSDVISGRSVILVPCFQDGGAIHLASDVRSVMEVAGTMLAAHSPGKYVIPYSQTLGLTMFFHRMWSEGATRFISSLISLGLMFVTAKHNFH